MLFIRVLMSFNSVLRKWMGPIPGIGPGPGAPQAPMLTITPYQPLTPEEFGQVLKVAVRILLYGALQ